MSELLAQSGQERVSPQSREGQPAQLSPLAEELRGKIIETLLPGAVVAEKTFRSGTSRMVLTEEVRTAAHRIAETALPQAGSAKELSTALSQAYKSLKADGIGTLATQKLIASIRGKARYAEKKAEFDAAYRSVHPEGANLPRVSATKIASETVKLRQEKARLDEVASAAVEAEKLALEEARRELATAADVGSSTSEEAPSIRQLADSGPPSEVSLAQPATPEVTLRNSDFSDSTVWLEMAMSRRERRRARRERERLLFIPSPARSLVGSAATRRMVERVALERTRQTYQRGQATVQTDQKILEDIISTAPATQKVRPSLVQRAKNILQGIKDFRNSPQFEVGWRVAAAFGFIAAAASTFVGVPIPIPPAFGADHGKSGQGWDNGQADWGKAVPTGLPPLPPVPSPLVPETTIINGSPTVKVDDPHVFQVDAERMEWYREARVAMPTATAVVRSSTSEESPSIRQLADSGPPSEVSATQKPTPAQVGVGQLKRMKLPRSPYTPDRTSEQTAILSEVDKAASEGTLKLFMPTVKEHYNGDPIDNGFQTSVVKLNLKTNPSADGKVNWPDDDPQLEKSFGLVDLGNIYQDGRWEALSGDKLLLGHRLPPQFKLRGRVSASFDDLQVDDTIYLNGHVYRVTWTGKLDGKKGKLADVLKQGQAKGRMLYGVACGKSLFDTTGVPRTTFAAELVG